MKWEHMPGRDQQAMRRCLDRAMESAIHDAFGMNLCREINKDVRRREIARRERMRAKLEGLESRAV